MYTYTILSMYSIPPSKRHVIRRYFCPSKSDIMADKIHKVAHTCNLILIHLVLKMLICIKQWPLPLITMGLKFNFALDKCGILYSK